MSCPFLGKAANPPDDARRADRLAGVLVVAGVPDDNVIDRFDASAPRLRSFAPIFHGSTSSS
jgi:hypothetical protein